MGGTYMTSSLPARLDLQPNAYSLLADYFCQRIPHWRALPTEKTPKAKKATKARRCRSEVEKKEQIKQRNRVAASKCRQKKKEKVDELKQMKPSLEARNNDLHIEFQRLRQEIGQVKSDLIHHTECTDPNVNRWVKNEAKGYIEKLVRNN
ncbi:hypothetical protein V8C42DRAFT_349780 [Trichoderma barbatum]